MKILAIEKELPNIDENQFKRYAKAEAERAWELYQAGIIRELYFRQDCTCAVLVLECKDTGEAGEILNTLPFVREGLIEFDIVPLIPYPGFSRLFTK